MSLINFFKMKKSTKAIITTGIVVAGLATGTAFLPEKTPEEIEPPQIECLTPDCEIEKLKLELKVKESRGEGLTRTIQKIEELKRQLK